jgi:hypothetical protein
MRIEKGHDDLRFNLIRPHMSILSYLISRFYPAIYIPTLPMRTEDFAQESEFAAENVEKLDGYTESTGRSKGDRVVVFTMDDHVHGVRYDLGFAKETLKGILNRSSMKYQNAKPEVLMDVDNTFIAKLGGNRISISGYIGALGVWTSELYDLLCAESGQGA